MVERTFRAGEKVERVTTESRTMQFLYRDGDELHLMDNSTYEQLSVPASAVENDDLLAPNTDVQVLFVRDSPLRVELPTFVELAVTRTDPGVKGDTVSNVHQARRARDRRHGRRAPVRQRGRPPAHRHPHPRVLRPRVTRAGSLAPGPAKGDQ